MPDYIIDGAILTDIADTIREKTGETEPIPPQQFPAKVAECYEAGEAAGYAEGHAEAVEEATAVDGFITRGISGSYYNDRVSTIGARAFMGCSRLTAVCFPAVKRVNDLGLRSANLRRIDLPVCTYLASEAVARNDGLVALILRADTVCTLSSTGALYKTAIESGTGYIYVPAALVDSYKTATNWSTFADQIRAIEDYPDITGG